MNRRDRIAHSLKDKKFLNKLFIGLMCLFELIILGGIAHITVQFIKDPGEDLYNLTALGILLLWFGILTAYYAWAVYFYNINMGLTNEDWAEIREARRHSPESVEGVPTENPNINETLGLPTGTVRGSLALTLMVSALAMTIAALGMPSEIKENSFIVDNFDFIKTAFLMMIAFYFGHKSLELIGYKSKSAKNSNNQQSNLKQPVNIKEALSEVSDDLPVENNVKQDVNVQREKPESSNDDEFYNPNAVQ